MQAPSHLPVPIDDGACDHLPGIAVPSLLLPSTVRRLIDLARSGTNGHPLLFNDGPTRSALAGGMGLDPGSARLHTTSLRLSKPLPGTRHV
jgi:hypothetical protein